jgi:sugar O-acyltransferase (sialic acid O-acetyltransferase NeuD family)
MTAANTVILGAGGHGREVAQALQTGLGPSSDRIELVGFLDDNPELHGRVLRDLPVLGPIDRIPDDVELCVLGVGYPEVKRRIVERVRAARDLGWPAVVHPWSEAVEHWEEKEVGIFVQAGVMVTTDVEISPFVTINVGCTVSHDCELGEYCTLSPGVNLGGGVKVGEGAFIGIGATVIQGVQIGAWSVVGAGAVVTRNVEPNSVVVGVPAREIDRRPAGWHLG